MPGLSNKHVFPLPNENLSLAHQLTPGAQLLTIYTVSAQVEAIFSSLSHDAWLA
jgi:hypothetical protein